MIKCSRDLPIETFQKILYDGFYYIHDSDIYWEPSAVFMGNGYHDSMIRTHFLESRFDGDKPLKDAHYWDWAKKEDVFDFADYGKTWCVDRKILKDNLND